MATILSIKTSALNSSVNIGVGDTIVVIDGYSSPFAQITILEDNAVIGTATSDSAGFFTITLTAQQHGIRNLRVYSTTTDLIQTDTVTYNINVTEHATTQLSTFLPTTINGLQAEYLSTDKILLTGTGRPNSNVIVMIDGTQSFQATTNSVGSWSAEGTLNNLAAGNHNIQVILFDNIGGQSSPTATRAFNLTIADDSPTIAIRSEDQTPVIIDIMGSAGLTAISIPTGVAPTAVAYFLASVILPNATLAYWYVLSILVAVVVLAIGLLLSRL